MTASNCTIKDLANSLGNISSNNLSQKLRGERKFSADDLIQILSAFPDLDANWLLKGVSAGTESVPSDLSLTAKIATYERMLEKRDKKIRELELLCGKVKAL